MKKKRIAFTINTLEEAENIILVSKDYQIIPILHFKNYILRGFGGEFIITLRDMLISKFGKSRFKFFVDCGFNNGLCINMASNKINYIKIRGNSKILKKLNNIANKNKVLLNPKFSIVDLCKIKNIEKRISKIEN